VVRSGATVTGQGETPGDGDGRPEGDSQDSGYLSGGAVKKTSAAAGKSRKKTVVRDIPSGGLVNREENKVELKKERGYRL